jgi:DNA-binding beta-propeller fold protein YncE
VLLLVLVVGGCLASWTAPALAGKGVVSVFGAPGAGDGQFSFAGGTAVNTTSGVVYVVDQFQSRVERFDADGGFLGAFGWGVADGNAAPETCTSGCQPGIAGSGDGQLDGPQGIAVDQSDGSVYVVDGNNNRVEKFDASGNYLSQLGSGGSAEGQLSGPQGIAVDPTDRAVYVADANNNRVEKFDSAGVFVNTFGFGVADGSSSFEICTNSCQSGVADSGDGAFSFPTRVAVDSSGLVYVLDFFNGRIERFTAADAFDEQFDPTDVNINTFPFEIAIGPGNDHLYVAQAAPDFSEQRVFEIDSSGTLVDTHGVGSTASNASGLALSSGSQRIYLADGFNARVFILDDITAPTATIDPATSVATTSASLSGSVTPNGAPDVGWHFEISTDDANWSPVAADQDAGSGNAPVPVSQDLSGLTPNTTYFARLAATRAFNAPTYSGEIQFTTGAIPPSATTLPAQDLSPTGATLTGEVHPHHSPTTYYFEYGLTTAYGASVPAAQDGDAGSADDPVTVAERIGSLQPATTYHYRLVATNQAGTSRGDDETFTTTGAFPSSTSRAGIAGTGFLPDDRGWEKVSPDEKNGGDVMADSSRVRAAVDGSAADFSSLAAFGDAIGTSSAADYMSVRGADGWSTHAITPAQAPLTVKQIQEGLQTLYVGLFSDDLSTGVLLSWLPVTNDPDVANVANIYVRRDLKTPDPDSYQLVSACPLCASTGTPLPPLPSEPIVTGGVAPTLAGASVDYGHLIFESQQPLTSDTPSGCANFFVSASQCPEHLYEWDHGTVRLAGILPDGTPAHASQAGQGAAGFGLQAELTPHTVSADGSRITFTVPSRPISREGALYMRINHATTVQINASERDPANPDPGGAQPATYWDASVDGTRVFFSSNEALTDSAPADGSTKLYVYDASKPDDDPHNLTLINVDHEPGDPGDAVTVLGASADGHFVYFSAVGQLVAGQPVLGADRALYVWHDGTIKYIAKSTAPDLNENTAVRNWVFRQPTARVTPDGLHLLFSSTDSGLGPTGYDQGTCGDTSLNGGCRELYVYSYDSSRAVCASCNPSGAPATASAFATIRTNNGDALTTWTQNHPLSADGRRVFFSTAEALVPQDLNGKVDVYEYDVSTGTPHLLTSGKDRSASYFMDASPSGNDALFVTRAQLVASDADGNYDLYDARVDGGFPPPPPAPPACAGDSCQGQQHLPPTPPRFGTGLTTGGGGVHRTIKPKSRRCGRGFVRKRIRGKVRCVRRHKAKSRKRTTARGRTAHSRRAR